MKKYFLLFCFTLLIIENVISQEYKPDNRSQLLKEDDVNKYKSENISKLDLLEALEFSGIRIHKFDLGKFDKKYDLCFFVDKYTNGVLTNSDTIMITDNTYHYYLDDDDVYYIDFINQVKVTSKLEDGVLKLKFNTYAQWFFHEIEFETTDKRQFFNIRDFEDAEWKQNEKIPLFIFASSWLDTKNDIHRFCGAVTLRQNDKDTELLLERSPLYYVINYKIEKVKN